MQDVADMLMPSTRQEIPRGLSSSHSLVSSPASMPIGYIEQVGRNTNNTLAAFGEFSIFCGRVFQFLFSIFRLKNLRLLTPQMYEVGVRSVPVVAVTGAFIGMVLAIETH